jgi:DNA-binding NtrC family response regulator
MESINILIIGTNKPIIKTIERLINQQEQWQAAIAFSVDEAYESCLVRDFNVVLIGAGLTDKEENLLKQRLNKLYPHLPLIKHYGGGSGLLFAEIYQAIRTS